MFAAHAGAPTGDDLQACATPGQVQLRHDTWARIRSPQYAANEGERTVTTFAAPAAQRGWVYVTNGAVVQLSTSAGCTWDHIYPVPGQTDAVAQAPRPRIVTQLVAPAPTALWIASYDAAGDVTHPHVERTLDATPAAGNRTRASFESFDQGLPAVGRPLTLAVSEVNTDQAYLLIDTTPDVQNGTTTPRRQLFRTSWDATLQQTKVPARTWDEITPPEQVPVPAGVEVAPTSSATIWIWQGSRYAVSTDQGFHWKAGTADGAITAIDVDDTGRAAVFTHAGEGAHVTFAEADLTVVGRMPVPVVATRAAHAHRYGVYAIADAHGTYGWDVNRKQWISVHPHGVPEFAQITFASSGAGRILLGQAEGSLYRLDLWPGDAFLKPPRTLGGNDIEVNRGGSITRPTLGIQYREVTVAPTQVKPDDVDFGTPPNPVPIDVFFLVDTTQSMGAAIAGLRTGVKQIAAHLKQRTHGSACFGVGDVKDESLVTAKNGGATVQPYKLVLPITCDLGTVQHAVDQLQEGGGNSTQAEAQTLALTQAVTGKGQVQPPTVLPGQDAHFTAPTRVIVLVTDAEFMQGTVNGNTFPTIPETVKTLNAYHDVKVVGVVVHDENDFPKAKAAVTAVVAGTHTYAPAWGVDCDGIGGPDVGPGEPLVCETENSAPAIEPAIVALLLNVKDPATMAMRVDDPYHVVKSVDGTLSRIVDRKRENHLPSTLHLTCSPAQDGQDLPVTLYGSMHDDVVGDGRIVVHCRAPLVPPKPPLPPIPDPIVARPVLAPILLPQPQPLVQNPPNQLNMNAGLSHEEQQQFQLAAVGQDASEQNAETEEAEELAMSARPRHEDRAAAGLLLASMALASAGATAVWMSRFRTQRTVARAGR